MKKKLLLIPLIFSLSTPIIIPLAETTTVIAAETKNGFVKEGNNFVYYTNGKRATGSDIVYAKKNGVDAWWYIENGVFKNITSVEHNQHGWWYVKNGKVDFTYTGFAKNAHGVWWIEKGQVTFKKNDIIYTTWNGVKAWYNIRGSALTPGTNSNRVYNNAHGWFYIDNNGKVDFSKTSVEPNQYGWWYIKKGKVDFSYNGIANNANGWWYIKNGKVDFSYNGLKTNENGTWIIQNGKVNFNYNGTYKYNNFIYTLKGGRVINTGKYTINNGRKTIIIGDSRTDGAFYNMYGDYKSEVSATKGLEIWMAKVGMGYTWMKNTAIPAIEKYIDDNTDIIILLGINDVNNVNNYASYINTKANEWAKKGAKTYFVSVNPIRGKNTAVTFNNSIKGKLNGNVKWINTHDNINFGYSSDGIHYNATTNKNVLNYVLTHK